MNSFFISPNRHNDLFFSYSQYAAIIRFYYPIPTMQSEIDINRRKVVVQAPFYTTHLNCGFAQ